jgi:hypothetical protein
LKILNGHWSKFVIAVSIIGILFVIADQIFAIPILKYFGIIAFALSGIMVGLEGIVKKKVVLISRYNRRLSETYIGITAVAQGILIIFLGLFIIAISILAYFNSGQSVFHYFIRHPGIPLLIFGFICFLSSTISILGSVEEKQGTKFLVILNLLTSRLLPAIILIVIGLAATSLGVLEILNPQYFDKLGGGFLEAIFIGSTNGK